MAVKAGMFTLQPSSYSTPTLGLDGTHPAFQVDVGFEPALYIVITTGQTVENSWQLTPKIWGNVGVAHKSGTPGGNGLAISTGVNEMWYTNLAPSGFWSNSGVIWFRNDPSSGAGPAFFLGDSNPDGFRIGYPFGGYEGAYGTVCYYLAFQSEKEVARVFGYQGSPMPVTLGWEPSLIFSLGHGGGGPPGDVGLIGISDFSCGFGGFENLSDGLQNGVQWLSNGLSTSTSVEQVRFFDDGSNDHYVFGANITAQMMDNSFFTYGRSPTQVSVNYFDGFPQAPDIRVGVHLMEEGIFSGGSVTPNPVGVPKEVSVPFNPEAVIFLGPQDHHENGDLGLVPWGGRCIGFLTDDFQCCVAWGAYSHIGSVASFCTSDFSWISNFTSTQLSDPTNPNYGTAELGGPGFIMHTQALPKFNQYVRYVAIGLEEDAPGFFRRYGG